MIEANNGTRMTRIMLIVTDWICANPFNPRHPRAIPGGRHLRRPLAGGTSLSLQLGHRKSMDIDMFVLAAFQIFASV